MSQKITIFDSQRVNLSSFRGRRCESHLRHRDRDQTGESRGGLQGLWGRDVAIVGSRRSLQEHQPGGAATTATVVGVFFFVVCFWNVEVCFFLWFLLSFAKCSEVVVICYNR